MTRSLLIRERLKKRYNTEVEPHLLVNLNPVLFRASFSAIRKRERKSRRTKIEKEKPSFRRHRFHPSYDFSRSLRLFVRPIELSTWNRLV